MKIACASDIHGMIGRAKFAWPKADVLVLAGDICPNLSRHRRSDAFMQGMWLEDTFAPAMSTFLMRGMYDHIVMIPGNHDFVFQHEEEKARKVLKKIPPPTTGTTFHLLINETAIVDGKVFWGSPWTPWFWDWAFNFPDHNANFARARAAARACWEDIPDDVEVLITHGPPKGILDKTRDGKEVGCPWLLERLEDFPFLKAHIFGHIHESYGQAVQNNVTFVNAAVCTLGMDPKNIMQVIEV